MGRGELVDVALEESGDAPTRGRAARRTRPARRRDRQRTIALLLATALAAVVVAGGHSRAAVAARIAGAVALSVPLTVPLTPVWQARAGTVVGPVGGALLVLDPAGRDLISLDAADGRTLWSRPVPVGLGSCSLDDALAATLVVCTGTGTGLSSLVVTLDPSTGAELHRLTWPGAIAVSTIVDGDVVLVGSDDDGRVVARRWRPDTGTEVWTYRSEPDVVAPMATRWELGTGWVRVTSRSQVAVDLATGTAVPPDAPGSAAPGLGAPIPGSGAPIEAGPVTARQVSASDGSDEVRLTTTVGTVVVPGRLAPVPAGDATARDLALVSADGALAGLAPDGTESWRVTPPTWATGGAFPVLAADGVLVVSEGDTLMVVDARTGATLWTAPTGVTAAASAVSDGRLIAHVEHDQRGAALVAREPRSGRLVWREPLPDGPVARLGLLTDGTVTVATGATLVALR
jgi:outer membrane protein assembly factor BamB